ncbi:DUF6057 family protein [Phocaeicola barnesiae]|uniref:DUF6057 family protein n=1 Tax=Phocaeicola barnesiae TaxID=376804 RepID=UPI00037086E0|nr:DUF6057 family protein [Phocaeicola barnesiae]
MNDYASTIYKKTARWTIVGCGLLFSIFSFVFLYVFQRDVLEALHYSLAHGKTVFAPLGSAIVITLVLILLRWGVNSLLGLKGNIRSLSYFPSFLVLCALTGIGRDVYLSDYHSYWTWLMPLLLVLFAAVGFWLRHLFRNKLNEEGSVFSLVFWNVFILLAMCFMTVSISNTDRTFHHELQMERALRHKDYNEALKVGRHSMEASRTLTALRAIALTRTNQLGDKLFEYPQYYGSDGLFFANDSTTQLRYTNDSIYYLLGVRPYAGESRMEFLYNICQKETGRFTALHYYLAALLLDKNLKDFAKEISDVYEVEDTLPRYYREAMLLYQQEIKDTTSLWKASDSVMIHRYKAFQELHRGGQSDVPEINHIRKDFDDTYWWYFYYQK